VRVPPADATGRVATGRRQMWTAGVSLQHLPVSKLLAADLSEAL
jgi:hypothetical protein